MGANGGNHRGTDQRKHCKNNEFRTTGKIVSHAMTAPKLSYQQLVMPVEEQSFDASDRSFSTIHREKTAFAPCRLYCVRIFFGFVRNSR